MNLNRKYFTLKNMEIELDKIMEKYTTEMPTQVGLKLPKLKKVNNESPTKIKLPKLKKVTTQGVSV